MVTLAQEIAWLQRPTVEWTYGEKRLVVRLLRSFDAFIMRYAREADAAEPSLGYRPLLTKHFGSPVLAKILALLNVRIAKRQGAENIRRPKVVQAIRYLAHGGRYEATIRAKARLLLDAYEETPLIDEIATAYEVSIDDWTASLKGMLAGDEEGRQRVIEICRRIARTLRVPRGPRITIASLAHQYILETAMESKGYTWDDGKGDFTDAVTLATRLEFDQPRFTPRSAHRRAKAVRVKAAISMRR